MGLSINWLSVPLPEATPSSSEVPRTPERLSSTLALVPTSTRRHMLSQRVASSRRHVDVGAPEVSRSKHNYTCDMGVMENLAWQLKYPWRQFRPLLGSLCDRLWMKLASRKRQGAVGSQGLRDDGLRFTMTRIASRARVPHDGRPKSFSRLVALVYSVFMQISRLL